MSNKAAADSTAVRVALWRAYRDRSAAGFREARHVSAAMLTDRYFAGRPDGLRPPLNAEELLVATT
jgi:hypothetical protein